MDPSVVVFAVQAAVRLGRKINDVLIDETNELPLVLPLGNLYGDVVENDALEYFRKHEDLVATGGPYEGMTRPELVKAYRTIRALEDRLGDPGSVAGDAREVITDLHRFEQVKAGFGTNPPFQRILGEVAEISVDYFIAQPSLLEGDTNARKILSAFVSNLDKIEFSEGSPKAVIKDVLLASLKTLDANVSLVDDTPRLQTLIGGITGSLIEDYDTLTSQGDKVRREDLIKRIASSLLKGGAAVVADRPDLFLGAAAGDGTVGKAEELIKSALSQVVEGIADQEDLFTNASVELLFRSVLNGAVENADLFSDKKIFQEMIRNTLGCMAEVSVSEVFSEEMAATILENALVTFGDNAATFFNKDQPKKQFLSETLRAISVSLSEDLGENRKLKDLFTKKQLLELTGIVFMEVARQPERLLETDAASDRHTALAQIIGSVAAAVAKAPKKLVTGEGVIEILESTFPVVLNNVDLLLELDTNDPRQNLLYKVILKVAGDISTTQDPRRIFTRNVYEEIILGILPLVSSNIEAFLPDDAKKVADVIKVVLDLSAGSLKSFINGENMPVLVERLLWNVIWSQLDLNDSGKVKETALRIIKEAA